MSSPTNSSSCRLDLSDVAAVLDRCTVVYTSTAKALQEQPELRAAAISPVHLLIQGSVASCMELM